MYKIKILNFTEAKKWCRTYSVTVKTAVKSGLLMSINEKYFAVVINEDKETGGLWILDRIWKLTDNEMRNNNLHCKYRYKSHMENIPEEYKGVTEVSAGFSLEYL